MLIETVVTNARTLGGSQATTIFPPDDRMLFFGTSFGSTLRVRQNMLAAILMSSARTVVLNR
jgi:uncharacterized iron-regulated membrane protein